MEISTWFIILCLVWIIKKLLSSPINPYRFPNVHRWARQGKYFNFDGYPIFYYDSDVCDSQARTKPTLLLLHGYPTSSIDWVDMRMKLEEKFHLIAPDYIGYGLSAKPVEFNYTIAVQAKMIEQLMDSLNLIRFHILAHDVGVTVAQELLARQMETKGTKIQSIVFLNGGLFPEVHRPFVMMKLVKTPIIGVIIQFLVPRVFFGRAFNRVFGPQTKRTETQLDEMTELLFYKAPYNLLQQLQCYINERYRFRDRWVNAINEASQTRIVPIQFINGPYDPISGKHMVDRYQQIIANPDTRLLPAHIGHYPNLEDPTGTLKYFFDFHRSI